MNLHTTRNTVRLITAVSPPRSAEVIMNDFPVPSALPQVYHRLNDYMVFNLNFSMLFISSYLAYYTALDPIAAVRFDSAHILKA
jgi:hypothetical protein